MEPSTINLETRFADTWRIRQGNPETEGLLQIQDPDAVIYLWKFDVTSTYCEGMLVKQRTQDVPKKGNYARNSIEDFRLQSKEGFAEMSYFVYLPNLKVLALLAGKNAVKAGPFSKYVRAVVGIPDFELRVLLNRYVQQQFERWHNITQLQWTVKVGIGFSAGSPLIQSRSVGEMLEQESHPTVTVTQKFSNPKLSGSLPERVAKALVSRFLRVRENDPNTELKSVKVKGSERSDQAEAILDLLANKFRLNVQFESGNALSYRECQDRVRSVILDQQSTLRELIGDIR